MSHPLSITIAVPVISLQLLVIVFAIGAERRRNEAKVVPDEYDDTTVYGLAAIALLLISQSVLNGITRCLRCGKDLVSSCSTTCTVIFWILTWINVLVAAACLLAVLARNPFHTKYGGYFVAHDLFCAKLQKVVFAAAGALTLLSMLASILYYWAHTKADTGFLQKHHNQNEGLGLATLHHAPQSDNNKPYKERFIYWFPSIVNTLF